MMVHALSCHTTAITKYLFVVVLRFVAAGAYTMVHALSCTTHTTLMTKYLFVIVLRFLGAGAYMMALALNKPRDDKHHIKVKAKLLKRRTKNRASQAKKEELKGILNAEVAMWNERYRRFVRGHNGEHKGSSESFRNFLLFLSDACARDWIERGDDGKEKEIKEVGIGCYAI